MTTLEECPSCGEWLDLYDDFYVCNNCGYESHVDDFLLDED